MTTEFDPAAFDPATAPIEVVWAWLTAKGRLPDLAKSKGMGIMGGKASPQNYVEAKLYQLLAQATASGPVWQNCELSEHVSPGLYRVLVEIYAGYGEDVPHGQGEAICMWGDEARDPGKEARLRAAADLLLKEESLYSSSPHGLASAAGIWSEMPEEEKP